MTLTLQELSEKYNMSANTITSNFPRAKDSLYKKHGIVVEKIGRGQKAIYEIKDFSHTDPQRAVSLYQSMEKNVVPSTLAAGLLDLNFLVFIGIVSSPQRVFRGSYLDLLKYLEIKPTDENILAVRDALIELKSKDYLMYMEDPSDNSYFMAGILRRTENDMVLEIEAILQFKRALESTRKSWIPFMKVYLALHYIENPCTIHELETMTGLTPYKIRDCLQLLVDQNMIHKNRVTLKDAETGEYICLGQEIDLNAFGIAADTAPN